jgi:hypothetical protein
VPIHVNGQCSLWWLGRRTSTAPGEVDACAMATSTTAKRMTTQTQAILVRFEKRSQRLATRLVCLQQPRNRTILVAMKRSLLLFVVVATAATYCSAFVTQWQPSKVHQEQEQQQRSKQHSSVLFNSRHSDNEQIPPTTAVAAATAAGPRRLLLQQAAAAFVVMAGITLMMPAAPAYATYSAYSHREDDWKARQADGNVQFSSAASLRTQLREIAPMNANERRLFCPNGPTSAVSPLMENKCGDQLAMPSVYGRTEDAMGNSIPGFAGGFYSSRMSSSAISSSSADTGGLPNYSKYTGK